jgi:hypothetical protein
VSSRPKRREIVKRTLSVNVGFGSCRFAISNARNLNRTQFGEERMAFHKITKGGLKQRWASIQSPRRLAQR